ncbi:MAG: hypothetical protein ACJ784_10975 [Myxococcales bacterium]
MARKDLSAALQSAVRARALIRVERPFDPNALAGFAVGLGSWLVTIHSERSKRDRDICWIGTPQRFTDIHLEMREITPAARFETKHGRHSLASITKIDFGGGYEAALAEIARQRGEV